MIFFEFIRLCFETVVPGYRYYNSWHIKVIADRLQAAFEGKINRLIINMPPRSMKSICISIAWPAWILAMNPTSKIIVASYSQILSEKLSLDTRCILQSEWYKERFPHIKIAKDQNTKYKFQTEQRGFRFATSVGGTVTGEGGDFLIADDPLSPIQATSKKYRQKAIDWFNQTFMTRLNNRQKGVIIVVMHRLHSDDLTGHLLAKNKWHLLSIPLVAEQDTKIYSVLTPWVVKNHKRCRNMLHFRKEHDILLAQRTRAKEVEQIKIDLGSYAFSAQYQQNPLPENSGIINPSWIQYYKEVPTAFPSITQSWDTANSMAIASDLSVCTTWAQLNNVFYLLDLYRARLEYPALKKQVISLAERWQPQAILIESKASGQQLIQELKFSSALSIIGINPSGSKLIRFHQIIPMIESGRIFFPHKAFWLNDLECEFFMFPDGKYDDQVDSIIQYLSWIQTKIVNNKLRVRSL